MKTALALSALLLGGCAASVTSSTPRSVVINAGLIDPGLPAAQAMADAQCKQHGRFALVRARPSPSSTEYVFGCIE